MKSLSLGDTSWWTAANGGPLRANVTDVAFLGAQLLLRLRSASAGAMTAVGSGHDTPLERGAEVGLDWDDSAAWVVAADSA